MAPLHLQRVALLLAALAVAAAAAHATTGNGDYTLGRQGDSCAVTCGALGRTCIEHIDTGDSADQFRALGIACVADARAWWAPDQPCFVSGATDPNFGRCLGWHAVPARVSCQASHWATRRLCRCGDDISAAAFFGTGLSNARIGENETAIFAHSVAASHFGVMTHFWVTAPSGALDAVVFRYYIDDEARPSIKFQPAMAAGVGFNDSTLAPWGTKWIGLGAGNAGNGVAWFHNFRVPFQRSIRVTAQHLGKPIDGFYTIVRGALDMPIDIGGLRIPQNARLVLQESHAVLQPLEYFNTVDVPTGQGQLFMTTLAVRSGNMNFLEGCYHAYSPYDQPYPGVVFSTGTEDYYDSGWYFDAGQFHMPVSGFTHINTQGNVTWSAYRFHEMDPIRFSNGFRLVWRNGDTVDPQTGLKCYMQSGGQRAGNPTASFAHAYAWVYLW